MLFPREQWKDIEGYEGKYQVSSVGRVRSLNYRGNGEVRVLKLKKGKKGYLRVILCKDREIKTYLVHRLVAEAFVENPDTENKKCVDHIDTDRMNNFYKNLRWCTQRENCNNELSKRHYSEARKGKRCGENNSFYGKHHSEEARRKMSESKKGENSSLSKRVEIFKNGASLGVFSCVRELERQSEELFRTKLFHASISAVCLGKLKQYKGYTFRYVNK